MEKLRARKRKSIRNGKDGKTETKKEEKKKK